MTATTPASAQWVVPIDERELRYLPDQPLRAWRIFRVRRAETGFTLTAPLIHDPEFERYPSRVIRATCYDHDHRAPAPGCRCGLYAVVEGTLDSLSGYLLDSVHDAAPPIYAEVAATGRVFLDARGIRAEQIEIVRLAGPPIAAWPAGAVEAQLLEDLAQRYGVPVEDSAVVPAWLLANEMPQGKPSAHLTVDLDALVLRLLPPVAR